MSDQKCEWLIEGEGPPVLAPCDVAYAPSLSAEAYERHVERCAGPTPTPYQRAATQVLRLTPAQRLRLAARLVESVDEGLDKTEVGPCGECGLLKKANWEHFNTSKEFQAIARKLRAHAGRRMFASPDAAPYGPASKR